VSVPELIALHEADAHNSLPAAQVSGHVNSSF